MISLDTQVKLLNALETISKALDATRELVVAEDYDSVSPYLREVLDCLIDVHSSTVVLSLLNALPK